MGKWKWTVNFSETPVRLKNLAMRLSSGSLRTAIGVIYPWYSNCPLSKTSVSTKPFLIIHIDEWKEKGR